MSLMYCCCGVIGTVAVGLAAGVADWRFALACGAGGDADEQPTRTTAAKPASTAYFTLLALGSQRAQPACSADGARPSLEDKSAADPRIGRITGRTGVRRTH
jgi:hypothetical protein